MDCEHLSEAYRSLFSFADNISVSIIYMHIYMYVCVYNCSNIVKSVFQSDFRIYIYLRLFHDGVFFTSAVQHLHFVDFI